MLRYVFDTGALIAAERGKGRTLRLLRGVYAGHAELLVPLPVIAEWWRGRTDVRDEILAAARVVGTVSVMKAAGVALAQARAVDAALTVDAIVIATAALFDAVVVTSDPVDLARVSRHFSAVGILSV